MNLWQKAKETSWSMRPLQLRSNASSRQEVVWHPLSFTNIFELPLPLLTFKNTPLKEISDKHIHAKQGMLLLNLI